MPPSSAAVGRITLLAMALVLAASLAGRAAAAGAEPEVRSRSAGEAPGAATIANVAWLEGRWVGEGLGGAAEELYAPPADGAMMGAFRSLKADGKVNFYEFVVIAEREGSLVYRIKHYGPDGRAWEDRETWTEFRLVAATRDAIYFDGCTFERTGPDSMKVHVRIRDRAGITSTATFTYRRVS